MTFLSMILHDPTFRNYILGAYTAPQVLEF